VALLNLKKDKGKSKEESKEEEVPDKLPSLEEEKKEGEGEEKPAEGDASAEGQPALVEGAPVEGYKPPEGVEGEAPVEVKKEEGLAPDELPPLEKTEGDAGAAEAPADMPADKPKSASKVEDERLYFAKLMANFGADSVEPVDEKISGEDVMAVLQDNWEMQNRKTQVTETNKKILTLIQPLRDLEQEWYGIKDEIAKLELSLNEKKALLRAKNAEIKKKTDELGELFGGREQVAKYLRKD